jgi:hypothetical protein
LRVGWGVGLHACMPEDSRVDVVSDPVAGVVEAQQLNDTTTPYHVNPPVRIL